MSVQKEFLAEVHEGDIIELIYGEDVRLTGRVIKLTDSVVRVEAGDRSPRVNIDRIASYDILKDLPERAAGDPSGAAGQGSALGVSGSRMRKYLDLLSEDTLPTDEEVSGFYEYAKELSDQRPDIRQKIERIVSIVRNVQKNIRVYNLDDRLYEIRREILVLGRDCDIDEEYIDRMLGSVYLLLGRYAPAGDYFRNTDDLKGRIYSAAKNRFASPQPEDLDRYIVFEKTLEPYCVRLYALSAARSGDISALKYRCESRIADESERKLIVACLLMVCDRANMSLDWFAWLDTGDDEEGCVKRFFASIPASWCDKTDSFRTAARQNPRPVKFVERTAEMVDDTEYRSVIKHVDQSRSYESIWGYIRENGSDCFFHIRQVSDDILKKALMLGVAKNLEIVYRHGRGEMPGHMGDLAAYDIRLTEKGKGEAEKRISYSEDNARTHSGAIITYQAAKNLIAIRGDSGRVTQGAADSIIDPYLRAYLGYNGLVSGAEIGVLYNIDVRHQSDGRSNFILRNVRSADGSIEKKLQKFEIKSCISSKIITREELDGWPAKKEEIDSEKPEERLPLDQVTYKPLSPYTVSYTARYEDDGSEPDETEDEAYRENGGDDARQLNPDLPPAEPIPESEYNGFIDLEPYETKENLYYKAHNAWVGQRDYELAEEYYIKAIRARQSLPSAVADLISLYLGRDGRAGDAIRLLDAYGYCLPSAKRRNIEITVYAKKAKERPYAIRLCHLLEEALADNLALTTRLHYLILQGNTLCQIEEYTAALRSYKRFHEEYDRAKESDGETETMISLAENIKKGEEICYYYVGESEKAESIAAELVSRDPEDSLSRGIIDRTLGTGGGSGADLTGERSINMDRITETELLLRTAVRKVYPRLDEFRYTTFRSIDVKNNAEIWQSEIHKIYDDIYLGDISQNCLIIHDGMYVNQDMMLVDSLYIRQLLICVIKNSWQKFRRFFGDSPYAQWESDFENVITARNYIAHSNGMSIPEETRQKWYDSCDRILRIRSSLDE